VWLITQHTRPPAHRPHPSCESVKQPLTSKNDFAHHPDSNGPIEGTNTKFKLLKRQMYGRAGFVPQRQRILLS
jgi:transposase